jgi:thiamine biosynthesis lipoprotein ApbE
LEPILKSLFSLARILIILKSARLVLNLPKSLKKIFSRFTSDLDRFTHPAYVDLIEKGRGLEKLSQGAFRLRKNENGVLDTDGMAKGYIVDQVVEKINSLVPGLEGVVNAGGDLRFLNSEFPVHVRLGETSVPSFKKISPKMSAVATSQLDRSLNDPYSTTKYDLTHWRKEIQSTWAIVVEAPQCWIADALTKVVLYGEKKLIESICASWGAYARVFNSNGYIVESYGAYEV